MPMLSALEFQPSGCISSIRPIFPYFGHVAEHPADEGMGRTAELLVFTAHGFVSGHMGDRRTYCYRQGVLQQLSKGHSLAQDQLDRG